jgi:hypothetical protein
MLYHCHSIQVHNHAYMTPDVGDTAGAYIALAQARYFGLQCWDSTWRASWPKNIF